MIYCVEDDSSIRELVLYTLNSTGFEAKGFAEGAGLWEEIRKEKPDLILLDIMLPGEDGISILKKLRSGMETKKIPVILVTAKGEEYDKVIGLDSGADDYVTKPFGMMELVSRIKAVLRRTADGEERGRLETDNLILDIERHEVTAEGREVKLTLKEFDLLKCLLEHKGIVMTRDKLLTMIWGYDFDGETRTVDVHIRTLRQKLGECGDKIETIRGVGYRIGASGRS
ncbi:response regulator transcription factor [Anaerolentibacter hominis]|uniref:response regulator transcription factor n=1 Tax=Anaerolentibacter hominis TaxID=3079009 RepID=UPI0031B89B12